MFFIGTETAETYPCLECNSTFNKPSKLAFHKTCCPKTLLVPNANPSIQSSSEQKSSAPQSQQNQEISKNKKSSIVVINHESPPASTSEFNGKDDPNLSGGGIGFKMPDNFDLPDEIIQEQLPAARWTSTPIRYADDESKTEKGTPKGIPKPSSIRSKDEQASGSKKNHHEKIKKKVKVAHDGAVASTSSKGMYNFVKFRSTEKHEVIAQNAYVFNRFEFLGFFSCGVWLFFFGFLASNLILFL